MALNSPYPNPTFSVACVWWLGFLERGTEREEKIELYSGESWGISATPPRQWRKASSVISYMTAYALDTRSQEGHFISVVFFPKTQPAAAAAAAKSLQLCPTLYNPIDGSLPGSPIPGVLQARTLEWVAISFSNAWKWKVKVKLLSHVQLFATPWTAAYQTPPSMGVSRQEYWSGVPLPSPKPSLTVRKVLGKLPNIPQIAKVLKARLSQGDCQSPQKTLAIWWLKCNVGSWVGS